MRGHTAPFITPVCRCLSHTYGEVEGSGTFLSLLGHPHLLSNEHIARVRKSYRLAHFLDDGGQAAAVIHPFWCLTAPQDVAIAPVVREVFVGSSKRGLSASSMDERFQPVDGEVVFIHGYPGDTSEFHDESRGIRAHTCP